jgi:cyclopropane fatty-acyl-phospholipid synthase-like methyltransferase
MNRLHAALPTIAKKHVWDVKYAFLGYPRFVAPDDVLRYLSAEVTAHSSLLDLGCGRGSLLRALRTKGWTGCYCGVDISRKAISEAIGMQDQRSSWIVSDFESFRSPFKWDIVAMVESICYINLSYLPIFLENVLNMLNPSGMLLFRLHDIEKYREYIYGISAAYPQAKQIDKNLFLLTLKPE